MDGQLVTYSLLTDYIYDNILPQYATTWLDGLDRQIVN